MNSYGTLVLVALLAVLIPGLLLVVSGLLGPKRSERSKGDPYECGIPQPEPPRHPIPVKYYLVAVLFLLFDVEGVFLYPWAVVYRRLGLFGLVEMGVFLALLAAGLLYVWKRGALEWN